MARLMREARSLRRHIRTAEDMPATYVDARRRWLDAKLASIAIYESRRKRAQNAGHRTA